MSYENFETMTDDLLLEIEGGSFWKAASALAGGVFIGAAPIAGVATAIFTAPATPVVSVSAGVGAWSALTAAGTACLDYACK